MREDGSARHKVFVHSIPREWPRSDYKTLFLPEDVYTILAFDLLELSDERTEVGVDSFNVGARDVYDWLVSKLSERFPSSGFDDQNPSTALNSEYLPKLPQRPGNIEKWRQTWKIIRMRITKESVQEIAAWLKATHPELPHCRETVSKIIRAGQHGLLD